MADKLVVPGARTFSAYVATGGVAILSLVLLNVVADKTNWKGLGIVRDYATRRNG
jgi:hypothetical protein